MTGDPLSESELGPETEYPGYDYEDYLQQTSDSQLESTGPGTDQPEFQLPGPDDYGAGDDYGADTEDYADEDPEDYKYDDYYLQDVWSDLTN